MLLTLLSLNAFAFGVLSSACRLDHCCYLRFPRVFPQAAFDFKDVFVEKRKISTKTPIAPSTLSSMTPVEHLSCYTLAVKS